VTNKQVGIGIIALMICAVMMVILSLFWFTSDRSEDEWKLLSKETDLVKIAAEHVHFKLIPSLMASDYEVKSATTAFSHRILMKKSLYGDIFIDIKWKEHGSKISVEVFSPRKKVYPGPGIQKRIKKEKRPNEIFDFESMTIAKKIMTINFKEAYDGIFIQEKRRVN